MLLEYIQGQEWEMDEPVDLIKAAEIIQIINNTELDYYASQAPGFVADLLKSNVEIPENIKSNVKKAYQLAAEATSFPNKQIHADLGVHNLYSGSDGVLYGLDPSGMSGPIEFDAGTLSVFSGKPKEKCPENIPVLSEFLCLDEREVARWAIYRLIAACNRHWTRNENEKYQDALKSLPYLFDHYEF
jgi:fructosamine-3-kinase